jgi:hypothetical protein
VINFRLYSPLCLTATNHKYFKNVLHFYKYSLSHLQYNTPSADISLKRRVEPYKDIKTLTVTQKTSNLKATISTNGSNVSTFTVGTLLRHFKIKQGKFLRRSVKGTKLFLNSLKNVLQKKYKMIGTTLFVIKVSGFNYNLMSSKRSIFSTLTSANNNSDLLFLFGIKLSFTKQKEKRRKSIKKRLKKKILLNFLKSNKINLV